MNKRVPYILQKLKKMKEWKEISRTEETTRKKKSMQVQEQPMKKQPILTAQLHTQTHSGLRPGPTTHPRR